jgi:hypothetical protein
MKTHVPGIWPPRLKPLVKAVLNALEVMRSQATIARHNEKARPWR